jgi:phosphate-selective porin OprO/OprP
MKKKHALLTAGLSAVAGAVGFAANTGVAHADVTTTWNGASETREEDRRFHVNGRFQYDVADTSADFCSATGYTAASSATVAQAATPCLDGVRSYARRAFIGVDGRLTQNWRYNVKLDINMSGSPSVRADDLYLEYAGQDWSIIIGNNNAVSPMEDRDSSLNIPFNERSFLISASGVGKRPGLAFITNGGNWSWGASLQSNDTLDTTDTAANGTESWFVATRLTWAPFFEQTPDGVEVLHLGLYARHRDIGKGNGNALPGATGGTGLLTYSPNALSNKSSNNASVGGAKSDNFWDGEVAFQWNSFGAEAEYGQIDAQDQAGNSAQLSNATATGYYVDVFWSPTGESRRYSASDGSFGAIAPRRTLGSDGGIGHIMLSARYEDLDLTDQGFWKSATDAGNANETKAFTLGATWVPVSHVKFQLNYSQTKVDYTQHLGMASAHSEVTGSSFRPNQNNTIDAVVLRTQFDW